MISFVGPALGRTAMRRKTVLLLPSKESSLKEMLFLSERLQGTGRYSCVFVAKRAFQERWLEAVRRQNCRLVFTPRAQATLAHSSEQEKSSPQVAALKATTSRSLLRRWIAGPKRWLRALTRPLLLETFFKYRRYRRGFREDKRLADKLLDETAPDLILTPSDRSLGLETALLSAAKRRQIPSMVIPWAIWSTRGEIYSRKLRPDCDTLYALNRYANRLAARKHPETVIQHEGACLLFRPGEMILAAAEEGVLPPRPLRFFGGSGLSSRVAVESPHFYELCIERGVPQKDLAITGRASTDVLVRTLHSAPTRRAELTRRYQIDDQKRIILCALPNSAEQNLCSWEEHWEHTASLLDMLVSLRGVEVMVNLHPKSKPNDYQEIVSRFGAVLTTAPIEQFIPLCDLLVSTNSSSIVMAVGCQKPVVNLEVYGAVDNTYESCPGVITVRRWDQAKFFLQRILSDRRFYDQLTEEQRQFSDQWILMDGQCGRRLIAEADRLIHQYAAYQSGNQPASSHKERRAA